MSNEKRCEIARLLSQALDLADAANEPMVAIHIAQALELVGGANGAACPEAGD